MRLQLFFYNTVSQFSLEHWKILMYYYYEDIIPSKKINQTENNLLNSLFDLI